MIKGQPCTICKKPDDYSDETICKNCIKKWKKKLEQKAINKAVKDIFDWERTCEWNHKDKGVFNEPCFTIKFNFLEFIKLMKKYPHLDKLYGCIAVDERRENLENKNV